MGILKYYPPQRAPFLAGIRASPNTWFLGFTRVHAPNGISIGSSVFAGLTVATIRQTDRSRYTTVIAGRILCYCTGIATRPKTDVTPAIQKNRATKSQVCNKFARLTFLRGSGEAGGESGAVADVSVPACAATSQPPAYGQLVAVGRIALDECVVLAVRHPRTVRRHRRRTTERCTDTNHSRYYAVVPEYIR